MNQVYATAPALEGNFPLFESVFKQVCEQAQADQQPCGVVLAQLIYHVSCELFYGEMPLGHVKGVVEAAHLTVAAEFEAADAKEHSLAGEVGGAA